MGEQEEDRESLPAFEKRMEELFKREADSGHVFVDRDDALRLLRLVRNFRKLDVEAARYVETVIIGRTHFTGYAPYVGWKGLGLALNETLDERDRLRAKLAELEAK